MQANLAIAPSQPSRLFAAVASLTGANLYRSDDGGESWSSWYNQPTAQLYHVAADNAFPYRVCSGQQESGSVCISSRGDDGEITFRDWHPVGAEEYGYVTPDPLDPDIVFGGKLTRYDRRTAQAQNILPSPFRSADFRMLRTEPVIFSPVDPHTLYFATNTLWKTRDGGQTCAVFATWACVYDCNDYWLSRLDRGTVQCLIELMFIIIIFGV